MKVYRVIKCPSCALLVPLQGWEQPLNSKAEGAYHFSRGTLTCPLCKAVTTFGPNATDTVRLLPELDAGSLNDLQAAVKLA